MTTTISLTPLPAPRPIPPMVYGHFLEQAFFGNVEGGVFDEGSELSVQEDGPLRGCRADVIAACRELGLPVVRWPGGNFTSAYWWTDGTGPRDDRPRRLELAWGSEESNRFGTPEFLAWCEAVGTEPYLAHSARSVDDAARWVEYTNHTGDTTLTRQRAADGVRDAAAVRYWGLGNEVYGRWQMGFRPVREYTAAALEHARFMQLASPVPLSFIAVGSDSTAWTEAVVEDLGDVVDYVSLHLYGGSEHLVRPTPEEFDAVVAQAVFFEEEIQRCSHVIREAQSRAGSTRPLAIALDEWNMRHHEPSSWPEPLPGEDGGIADRPLAPHDGDLSADGTVTAHRVDRYSPRTLADALFYAGVFHVIHRTSQLPVPVGMANTVNLVNANGLLAVRPGGVVRATTYHVWDLYQNHTGPLPVPAEVSGPARTTAVRQGERHLDGGFLTRPATVAALDVSASTSEDGRTLFVVVINRSATEDLPATLDLAGGPLPPQARLRTLGAHVADLFAVNSLSAPDTVTLTPYQEVELVDGSWTFAAHSVSLLRFELPSPVRSSAAPVATGGVSR